MLTDTATQDPFASPAMTDAINILPVLDDGLGALIPSTTSECLTDRVQVDIESGSVQILPITARGAEPTPNQRNKRETTDLKLPVYEVTDTIWERENLQQIRETGSMALRTAETRRNIILEPMSQSLDRTRIWQRSQGWLTGIIPDADGSVWMNLWKRLGVEQVVKEWDLANVKFDLSEAITDEKDEVEFDAGGSVMIDRWVFLAGRNASKRLRRMQQVKEAATDKGRFFVQQRDNRRGVPIQEDVDIVAYSGLKHRLPNGEVVGSIGDDDAYLFPIAQGLARGIAGASDMKQFRGQILDKYVSIRDLGHGKGEEVLAQACFLHYCARPELVRKYVTAGPIN